MWRIYGSGEEKSGESFGEAEERRSRVIEGGEG
jgi:hypothetical protein